MAAPSRPNADIGYLLCDDMIFTSRVMGTAKDLGLTVRSARSVEMLMGLIQQQAPRCLIVDLANPGLRIADLVNRLSQTCSPAPKVIAYGSHVDTATLRAAKEAGCDTVLARSKFVDELPQSLRGWFGSGTNALP
jgi:CheY-like chemotaxis protein